MLLERRGGGPGGGGGEMQHIRKELQKCTTLTHSAYTFVVMSRNRQCNSSFWVHTLCRHLNTTRQKMCMLPQSTCSWQLCCPACAHNGLHEQQIMRHAAHLTVLSHHYGCLSYRVAIGVFRKSVEHAFCIVCLLPFLPLHRS